MKRLTLSFTAVFFLLTIEVAWSETVKRQYLVARNGVLYKQFSDVPYTGKVSGLWSGKVVDGIKVGSWKTYWMNGKLASQGKFSETGKELGFWKYYNPKGTFISKYNFSKVEE